jgi:hypothetical protein
MKLIKEKSKRIFFAILFSVIAVAATISVIYYNVLDK